MCPEDAEMLIEIRGNSSGLQYSIVNPPNVDRFEDLLTYHNVPLTYAEEVVITARNRDTFRVLSVELTVKGAEVVIFTVLSQDDTSHKISVSLYFLVFVCDNENTREGKCLYPDR